MPVLTPEITEEKQQHHGSITPPRWPDDHLGGGDDGAGDSGSGFPMSRLQVGMWLFVTVVVMLFAGLSSAYIVLRGFPTWQNIAIPPLVWVNTLILVVSSFTLESARLAVKHDKPAGAKRWVGVTALLGLAFVAGQLVVWRQLVAAGVYLPSTMHSSFFYVLTGLHGVHILGGLIGLGLIYYKAMRGRLTPLNHEPLKACALYWHCMDAIWVYLFLLLMLV